MVLNPVSSGLVSSMRRPGGRVTGASLDIPPQLHFRALREIVKAERVAVLFNPEKTGPVVREAKAAARREGIELVPIPVSGPAELDRALERVDDSFDALWSVADVSVLSRGVIHATASLARSTRSWGSPRVIRALPTTWTTSVASPSLKR